MTRKISSPFFVLLCLVLFASALFAQISPLAQADRIAAHPNLTPTARLTGHIPGWARADNDLGSIADTAPMHLALVLNRSPERQTAFTQLLADQQNPASSSYHHWLMPKQVGEQYGPTQHDIDSLTAWLTSQGLTVAEIAPSRVFVNVTAPASVVSRAFATSLHSFRVEGTARTAPTAEPRIPSAFLPIVGSITGLADTPVHPMHQRYSMTLPPTQPDSLHPEFTSAAGNHYVTPGDFSAIFDLNPTYSAGFNGAGQKVAIIGRSRVVSTDISQFEANTGLATNLPNTIIPTTGVDPGTTGDGDQSEATLDVIRVIGTAPGVQADLVVSGTAGGFNGIYVAAQYNVQTLLDPVMNISFGSCEVYAGPSQVNLWDTLFAQAASEGISVFVSSADSGAATCDTQFGLVPAYQFRSINYICSSSYATCVGGTEFADTANPAAYWSTTNSPGLASALSYIPEGAWNEPSNVGGFYTVASGGGGASIYIPKPVWQTGTGVPADGARDVPDVSFPASGHDGYFGCYGTATTACSSTRFNYFSGTSAAAPTMAAVTAILNQKTGSSQGNLNPLLYRTAASTPSAFHDATPASSGVAACSTATASLCNNSVASQVSLTGGLAGFALTTGYDQATGLGSLDITNFLNAASAPTPALALGKLTLSESATVLSRTQTVTFTAVFTSKASGTPSGTVQFYANAAPLGSPITIVAGKAVTPATPMTAAGNYDITAIYSGDATFAQTTAPGIALIVAGLASTPKISFPPNVNGNDPSLIPVGTSASFIVTIPAASGSPAPTGMVRFYSSGNGTGSYLATVPLSGGGATSPSLYFSTVGGYTLTAYYLGDSIYSPSNSAAQLYTVQKLQSVAKVTTTGGTIGTGGYQQYYVNLNQTVGSTTANATGTIQLYSNGVALGSPFAVPASQTGQAGQSTSPAELFSAAGTYMVTAVYSGDANWQSSASAAITQTVTSDPASYSVTPSASSFTLTAASSGVGNATVKVQSGNGFQGTVNLACTITSNGPATVAVPPTCSLSASSVAIAIPLVPAPVTLAILTVAPHARPGASQASMSRLAAAGSALCTLIFLCLPRRRRVRQAFSSLILLFTLSAILSACGSSSSTIANPTPISPGTTAGSYTATITASTTAPGAPVAAPSTIAVTIN